MLCGSWFQIAGPWCAELRRPVDFVSTEGIGNRRVSEEERSCREGTQISRTSARYLGPVPVTEENRWKRVCTCFAAGLEASEVHAEVGKYGQV